MSKWSLALSIVLIAPGSALAATSCADVSFSQPATIGNWNPIAPGQQQAGFTATITRATGSIKTVRLILLDASTTQPLQLSTSGPVYTVLNGSEGIVFPSGTSVQTANTTLIDLGGNKSQNVPLTFTVPANSGAADWVGGASYVENLGYAIQCFTANGKVDSTSGPFSAGGPTLRLTIPSIVSATIAQPAVLDFQNFTSLSQLLNISVKSTASVNVAVANPGFMSLNGSTSPPDNSKIGYSMTLDSAPVAAGSSSINRPRATVGGRPFPLLLTLAGNGASGKLPGNYTSTIVVTLSPGT